MQTKTRGARAGRAARNDGAAPRRGWRWAAVAALALSLSACASMETMQFQSLPEGASVVTSNGLTCPATPCTIEVPRKEEFVATFRKEGFAEADVPVRIVTGGRGAAEFAASAIGGGFVGAIAYGASGRGYDHEPNPVVAELQPIRPAAPARRPRKPARSAAPSATPAM